MRPQKLTRIILLTVAILSFVACKKNMDSPSGNNDKYISGRTRVLALKGTDTVSTPMLTARVETEPIILATDSDTKLKADLIAYQSLGNGLALYTLRAINLTDCQSIIRWNWQGLTIDSISPPSDVIHAHDTVIFKLWGDAKVGKITLNSQADNPTSCGNSKTLVINITTTILPVKFIDFTVARSNDMMTVNFTAEYPQDADEFVVLWSPDGNPAHEIVIKRIKSDGVTKKYTVNFLAFIYEG